MYLLNQSTSLQDGHQVGNRSVPVLRFVGLKKSSMNTILHIIWGREAVSRYRLGQVDAHVRFAYSNYFFKTPDLCEPFLRGVREAREADDWMVVTNAVDVRRLGAPMRSQLIEAVRKGDMAAVKTMLAAGVKLDSTDEKGLNALHHAAQAGQPDVVNALVDAGAQVDAAALNSSGKTALHYACESDLPNTALAVKVLLDTGADANARDANGNTALHSTLLSSDHKPAAVEKKAQSLVGAGADPRAQNQEGHSSLSLVAMALSASPAMLDRVVQMLMDADHVRQAHDLARLATVKRMAPGARQDFIRPSGLG